MTRLLLAAAAIALLATTGCRHSCNGNASLFKSGCSSKAATPVSYPGTMNGGPMTTYPASFSSMVTPPPGVTGVPTVPFVPTAGMDSATELPFPGAAIPPTNLPASPVGAAPPVTNPGAARSASLPK